MTAMQLNSEFFAVMSEISAKKGLMEKVVDFAKGLLAEKKDDTLMTKEEFYAKIEQSEKDLDEGKGIKMLPGETLSDLIRRVG